jgi:hypothetical protein
VSETFAQEFCSVAPCRAGGWVITGVGRVAPCLIRVADGELTIIQRGRLVLRLAASELEIVSPALRRLAQVVILRANGNVLAVEFDFAYQRRKILTSRQRGVLRWAQAVFLASSVNYLPARRLGHRLAAEFTAALLAAGAHEKNPGNG